MALATYPLRDGRTLDLEYDPAAPCRVCGEPVIEASMGGTDLCPWCDCGHCRYCRAPLIGHPSIIKTHMESHHKRGVDGW